MNKNVLCLILAVFLSSACGQTDDASAPVKGGDPTIPVIENDIEFPGCEVVDVGSCPNPDRTNPRTPPPPVMIQVIDRPGTKKIQVLPKNICADPGEVIHFDIIGPPAGKGSVSILPKNFVDSWLIGTNSAEEDEIEILVPSFVAAHTKHDYLIVTSSGLCVDPRVHVR